MKISTNPSTIQYVTKSFQSIDEKNRVNSKEAMISKGDTMNASSSNQSVSNLQSMQQNYIHSQQMFGALTQLSEALELFQKQPSVYEQNMKEIIEKVKKEFPQLSKYIKSIDNSETMIEQVEVAKKQLFVEAQQQKKNIALKLVAEQNQVAVRHNPKTQQPVETIVNKIQNQNIQRVHVPRIDQITQLLS